MSKEMILIISLKTKMRKVEIEMSGDTTEPQKSPVRHAFLLIFDSLLGMGCWKTQDGNLTLIFGLNFTIATIFSKAPGYVQEI